MNTLEHYVEASAIARKLRDFSDNDLAWIADLSPPNMAWFCQRFETTERILRLAQSYEVIRRIAFPSRRNEPADARGTTPAGSPAPRAPLRIVSSDRS